MALSARSTTDGMIEVSDDDGAFIMFSLAELESEQEFPRMDTAAPGAAPDEATVLAREGWKVARQYAFEHGLIARD